MQINVHPMALIKFVISNPFESKKFISIIRLERIFLSLTGVLEGGDLKGGVLRGGDLEGGGDGASLASLLLLLLLSSLLLFSSLLLVLWH